MSDLMKASSQEQSTKFEIISDLSAMDIYGGHHCERLQSCGTFEGTCGSLRDCGTYAEK